MAVLNRNIHHHVRCPKQSAKDVAGFGVMFFIVFFAFAQLGFLLFGTQVRTGEKGSPVPWIVLTLTSHLYY